MSPIINPGGGGGGGSQPTWLTNGNGSPFNTVTPSQRGAVYVDTTNGGIYVAVGATSADWMQVGGVTDPSASLQPRGVAADTGLGQVFLANVSDIATLTDIAALSGTQNGIYWDCANGDTQQVVFITLGNGNRTSSFEKDGTFHSAKGVFFPTADPHITGAWWDNAGTLTKSAG